MATPNRPIDRALALAEAKGWNQSEFATRMDVGPADITNWKARGMPPKKHEKAARVLGCSVDELLGREKSFGKASQLPDREQLLLDSFRGVDELVKRAAEAVVGSPFTAFQKAGKRGKRPDT